MHLKLIFARAQSTHLGGTLLGHGGLPNWVSAQCASICRHLKLPIGNRWQFATCPSYGYITSCGYIISWRLSIPPSVSL
jgi:hypothetical protein